MIKVRNWVFETNSSSTHSLTIRKTPHSHSVIPENSELDICREVEFISNQTAVSEMEKLRYLVSMIALYMEHQADHGEAFDEDYYSFYGEKSTAGWRRYQKDIFSFPWLVWLCEVVKEERDTILFFDKNVTDFPYISEKDGFEDEYVWEALGLSRANKDNKEVVKELFRDIIFNNNIVLEDAVDEY